MSCLVWAFSSLSFELHLLPASLRRSPVQLHSRTEIRVERAFPLSAFSGPPHLLSWWVGSYRRSPLFLKLRQAGLLECHFSSLHSWSFTFVSEVTFSACFSFFFYHCSASQNHFLLFLQYNSPSFFFCCLFLHSLPSVVYCSVAMRCVCLCVYRRRLVLQCWQAEIGVLENGS